MIRDKTYPNTLFYLVLDLYVSSLEIIISILNPCKLFIKDPAIYTKVLVKILN